jgi:hypothetical protein
VNSTISNGVFVAAVVLAVVLVVVPSPANVDSSSPCFIFGSTSKSNPATRLQSSFRRDNILFLFLASEGSFDKKGNNGNNGLVSVTGYALVDP